MDGPTPKSLLAAQIGLSELLKMKMLWGNGKVCGCGRSWGPIGVNVIKELKCIVEFQTYEIVQE